LISISLNRNRRKSSIILCSFHILYWCYNCYWI